jgi:DNA-binding transcriptional LysR family regulator
MFTSSPDLTPFGPSGLSNDLKLSIIIADGRLMFDELHHFVLIAETGSFTAAARRAHLTQPALTASIHRLEDSMGARLLDRRPRGAIPTAAGLALLPRARAALAAVADGQRAVREVLGLEAGQVVLGGGSIACTYLLPAALAAFHAKHPGVALRLLETATPAVREAVDAGDLDLGICEDVLDLSRDDAWLEDPLVLVATPELANRWSGADTLRPGTPVVTFTRGTSLRRALDLTFPDVHVVSELGSVSAVKGFARAGLGVALVSKVAVSVDLRLGRLVEVSDRRTPPPRRLVVHHRGGERLPPAASAVRAHLLGCEPRPH